MGASSARPVLVRSSKEFVWLLARTSRVVPVPLSVRAASGSYTAIASGQCTWDSLKFITTTKRSTGNGFVVPGATMCQAADSGRWAAKNAAAFLQAPNGIHCSQMASYAR